MLKICSLKWAIPLKVTVKQVYQNWSRQTNKIDSFNRDVVQRSQNKKRFPSMNG